MDKFNIGDVVVLKSGGPRMTVKSVGEDWVGVNSVFVAWFDSKMNAKDGAYPIEAVELAPGYQTR